MKVDKPLALDFSNLFIVQSLDDEDYKTGRQLFDEFWDCDTPNSWGSRVSFAEVENAKEFCDYLVDLTEWTRKTKARPWLHVECHGSNQSGLSFANSSELGWVDFCEKLRPLNKATEFNLLVGASACYGTHMAQGLTLTRPAPCYGVLGPTHEAHPSELLGHFRDFYRTALTSMDIDEAIASWKNRSMSDGMMGFITAEDWWESIATELMRDAASPQEFGENVRTMYKRLKAAGHKANLGSVKRLTVKEFPIQLQNHFDEYFLRNSVPSCRKKFSWLREKLDRALVELSIEMRKL